MRQLIDYIVHQTLQASAPVAGNDQRPRYPYQLATTKAERIALAKKRQDRNKRLGKSRKK